MRKYFLLLLTACIGLFTACESDDSSTLDPSIPFYQDLQVEYDATHAKTHAAANFNKDNSQGENITLSGKSSIRFNGEKPNYANIAPYFYTYTFSHLKGITFKFTRTKGEVYVNHVSPEDAIPIGIPADFTTVHKSSATTFTWEGAALGEDEEITITISSESIGSNYFYEDQEGAISKDIEFATPVPAGKATFSVSRVKTLPIQESDGTAGGRIQVVYTVSKEINIGE